METKEYYDMLFSLSKYYNLDPVWVKSRILDGKFKNIYIKMKIKEKIKYLFENGN